MATDGVAIGLLKQAAEVIAAAAAKRRITAATEGRLCAMEELVQEAAEPIIMVRRHRIQLARVPVLPTPQRRMAPLTQPHHTARADTKVAASISS
jgi:hypothetical protein